MLRISAFIMFGLFCLLQVVQAEQPAIPAINDPSPMHPLGRFRISGDQLMHSPDSFHVLSLTSIFVELPIAETEDTTTTTPVEPEFERITTMQMWDIRGGKQLWSREIEDRDWEDIAFSPSGDTLYIRSLLDQDDDDPQNDLYRLTVYDPLTGEILSQSENISPIQVPFVPGEISQPLSVSSRYITNQRFLTTAFRPFAGSYCVAWDVKTTSIVWVQQNECGLVSPLNTYLAVREPHSSGSAYDQISIYILESGEQVISSPDEVVDFQWLDDHTLILHRPYGDPPVVWEILNNTRAAIEQPYRMGIFYPGDALTEMYQAGGEVGYYVWDKTTGKLLRETEINGRLFPLDNRMVVLEINPQWSYLRQLIEDAGKEDSDIDAETLEKARQDLAKAFLLRDFITGEEIWAHSYQHGELILSSDQTWGYAYDRLEGGVDLFDLRTGEIWGGLPAMRGDFRFTKDMKWIVQSYGNLFTIWGDESELGRFVNPPNTFTLWEGIEIYSAPSSRTQPHDVLPQNAYLWVYGQSYDGDWVIAQDIDGHAIFLRATGLKTRVPIRKLPVFDGMR